MTIILNPKENTGAFFTQLGELCGDDFHRCFQCGSCSASCPMMEHMQASPRKIMLLVRFGLVEKLKALNTYWICASCLSCQAICPHNIDIPRIMEALRLFTLRANVDRLEPSQDRISSLGNYPQIALISAFRKLAG